MPIVPALFLLACTAGVVDAVPSRPSSRDEIELVVRSSCPDGSPRLPRVEVTPGRVDVVFERDASRVTPPSRQPERVAVGRLPAGTWTVRAVIDGAPADQSTIDVVPPDVTRSSMLYVPRALRIWASWQPACRMHEER